MLKNGYIQVYTGDGKGKTTCAIGQGVRAVGTGLKVIMIQFLKGGPTGELNSLKSFGDNFTVHRFEKQRDFVWNLKEDEIEELKKEIREGFSFLKDTVEKGNCDMLIVDEIMGVLSNGFLEVHEVVEVLKSKKENMEIILTGRNVPPEIIEVADLVTEMKPIKHYFDKGVQSRKGIEF